MRLYVNGGNLNIVEMGFVDHRRDCLSLARLILTTESSIILRIDDRVWPVIVVWNNVDKRATIYRVDPIDGEYEEDERIDSPDLVELADKLYERCSWGDSEDSE